jgi:peptidoglycan/LPS O-acetylase OafA/YrhL
LNRFIPRFAEAPDYLTKPITGMGGLAVTFVVAWLSYHLYEQHFLRLKRFFAYARPEGTPSGDKGVADSFAKIIATESVSATAKV